MEALALFAVCVLTGIGWGVARVFFAKIISDENRLYFAPAVGAAVCGIIGYGTVRVHKPWLIWVLVLGIALYAIRYRTRLRPETSLRPEVWALLRFTLLTLLCLYGMQIALYGLFSRIYPGPHAVWTLHYLTGVPPPDQMFAWHQAMFASQHRHYPRDPFFLDMDLYDRPRLGGYITLFIFKLFHLPLIEENFVYPPNALRFYHCFWWLLNNLYLLGVAPLFKHLFGYRGAIIGVASTALGGFFVLCNAGAWMKFASAYPFLLAFLLFLEGKGPVLQAALCATSYYIHGSVLPFLAGFGILQILTMRYAILGWRVSLRAVAWFAAVGTALVGAWFINVKLVGSKQPLFYYYIYGAGLTEAQTRPVAELAKAFYARYTWESLSLFPVRSLLNNLLPIKLFDFIRSWIWLSEPTKLADLASLSFASQRLCLECALGLMAAPVVIAGFFKALLHKHAGKVTFCIYLIPTLIIALVYRLEWAFSLHILSLYHTLVLFCWVTYLRPVASRYVSVGLAVIALEGIVSVLFADFRFLPLTGLRLAQVPAVQFIWLGVYLCLILVIMAIARKELDRFPQSEGFFPFGSSKPSTKSAALIVAGKLLLGLLVIAFVVAIYALYCLRFYPAH